MRGDPCPPDPTEPIDRAVAALRAYTDAQFDVLRERLCGMDRAGDLLNQELRKVPSDLQLAVETMTALTDERLACIKELMQERFASVGLQFSERDIRAEQESRANNAAILAAFSAQKESDAKQDQANQKAIDKSEIATKETIDKLTISRQMETDSIRDQVNELKDRISRMESTDQGSRERVGDFKASVTIGVAAMAVFVSLMVGLVLKK